MSAKYLAAVSAFLLGLGCQSAPEGTVAFVNASVVPMDNERVLHGQTVVTSLGKISELGPTSEIKVPRGALVVDGSGKYLVPGLTEMHAHLPGADTPPEEVDRILFLFLSNGVTTVRGMLGNASHLELRKQIAGGRRLGPTIYAAGPAFRATEDLTADVARQRVREQHEAGFDSLKILEGLSVDVYDAIAEEATLAGIPFGGHVPNPVGLLHALAAGQGSIDHLDNYLDALEADDSPIKNADAATRGREMGLHADEKKIPALVSATKLANASAVPTMALWETFNADVPTEHYAGFDELKYLPRATVDAWIESQNSRQERLNAESGARVIEIRKKILKALQDEGARIAFGTDAPQIFNVPGFSIHREISIMASAGLTPYEILASATKNAAEHFGSDAFGRVEVGARADLVLLEANPLDDAANVAKRAGVMVRGRWLPEAEIQIKLEELAASASR
ncbi:MAG: amidohydrolase family protein [Acidobacteriia bacterium]|nr:amidohydrolase family protein [Terriglobia bacterium]MYK11212.1 amidohydrolase family protein [Terriglobia bacterium]